VANQAPDRERGSTPSEPQTGATSDLIGVRLTLYLGVAIIAILTAFFLVGPVVGIIVLLAVVVLGIVGLVAAIRRADESD
jgi:uncharacterized membrane protein